MYERDIIQNCLQRMEISTTEELLHVIYKLVNLFIGEMGFFIFYLKGQEKIEQLKNCCRQQFDKAGKHFRVVRYCES